MTVQSNYYCTVYYHCNPLYLLPVFASRLWNNFILMVFATGRNYKSITTYLGSYQVTGQFSTSAVYFCILPVIESRRQSNLFNPCVKICYIFTHQSTFTATLIHPNHFKVQYRFTYWISVMYNINYRLTMYGRCSIYL